MGDLRADLIAALREEANNLGCAGLPELDRIGEALERVAKRIERAAQEAPPPVAGRPFSQPSGYGPWFPASYDSTCDGCGCDIGEGDRIRADGLGGYLCTDCGES